MTRRTHMLIGSGAALLAWMLGYGMGGGFRIGGKGAVDSRDEADVRGSGTAGRKAGLHDGTTRAADDTLSDQIAARHIPWTRERLLNSVEAIGRQPDIMHAIRFGMKLTEQLGPDDFPLAIEIAEKMEDSLGEEGQIYKAMAFMRWAELKPEVAAEYLRAKEKIGEGFIFKDGDMVLTVWGASNPAAAIAWARTLKEDQQSDVMKTILEAVARRDPDAAIALAQAHAPELLKGGGVAEAVETALAKRDPERGARIVATLGDADKISEAARLWAIKDTDAAMRWARELPDEKLRTKAIEGAWKVFAAKNHDEAAAQLSSNPADAPFIETSAKSISRRLAHKDPQEAERWAATLMQPEARKEGFAAIGEHFAKKDTSEGGKWLNSLPDGADRNNAILGFVYAAKGSHPEEATTWATAVQNTDARRSALRTALSGWCSYDLSAAIGWLQTTTSISEEDRQAILKKE